jgi:hypothetical protein
MKKLLFMIVLVGFQIICLQSNVYSQVEGKLVKAGGPQIYLIESGRKRLIQDEATIKALDLGEIQQVTNAVLVGFPVGAAFPKINSPLIQSDKRPEPNREPEVYFVTNAKRRLIPDSITVRNLDLGFIDIIPDADLRSITRGVDLPSIPTSMIKGSGADIYVIRAGRKRRLPFSQAISSDERITILADAVLNSIPNAEEQYLSISNAITPSPQNAQTILCWFDRDEQGRLYSQTFGYTSQDKHDANTEQNPPVEAGGAFTISDITGKIYNVVYGCKGPYCGWSTISEPYEIINNGTSFMWRSRWGGRPIAEYHTAYYKVPRRIIGSTCPAGSEP